MSLRSLLRMSALGSVMCLLGRAAALGADAPDGADSTRQQAAYATVTPIEQLQAEGNRMAIWRKLSEPAHFKYDKAPLSKVAEDLERRLGMNVRIDEVSVQDGAPDPGTRSQVKISFDADGLPLQKALDRMLDEHALAFMVSDGELVISTYRAVSETGGREIYNLDGIATSEKDRSDLKSAIEKLTGGKAIVATYKNLLIVSGEQWVHREVRGFLADVSRELEDAAQEAETRVSAQTREGRAP